MFPRAVNILKSNSFFLFGARGTGKTSLLRQQLEGLNVFWIDLLSAQEERRFSENPDRLSDELAKFSAKPDWVVIDEVQKVPRLLDVVHKEIEGRKIKFALTGSSARKLRRGGANLLAGRAFVYHLFPLTAQELGKDFDLEVVTHWGALPKVISLTTHDERRLFLESYVDTYLREEVLVEQLVRNIVPFRKFLELAAQCSGTVVNVSNIASDLGVDPKTARSYFDILEDTLLGFTVPALERSIRKQQIKNPKFYFFDIGVKHALDGTLWKKQLTSQEFGIAFEHFIMNELFRLNSYYRSHFKFSYLRTKGGLEIDIVAEHPDHPLTFIEVKATEDVRPQHLEHLALLKRDFPEARALCICREPRARLAQGIEILPWQIGLDTLFKASYAPANS